MSDESFSSDINGRNKTLPVQFPRQSVNSPKTKLNLYQTVHGNSLLVHLAKIHFLWMNKDRTSTMHLSEKGWALVGHQRKCLCNRIIYTLFFYSMRIEHCLSCGNGFMNSLPVDESSDTTTYPREELHAIETRNVLLRIEQPPWMGTPRVRQRLLDKTELVNFKQLSERLERKLRDDRHPSHKSIHPFIFLSQLSSQVTGAEIRIQIIIRVRWEIG